MATGGISSSAIIRMYFGGSTAIKSNNIVNWKKEGEQWKQLVDFTEE